MTMTPSQWGRLSEPERLALILSVPCPICKADPEAICRRADGTPFERIIHYERVLLCREPPVVRRTTGGAS